MKNTFSKVALRVMSERCLASLTLGTFLFSMVAAPIVNAEENSLVPVPVQVQTNQQTTASIDTMVPPATVEPATTPVVPSAATALTPVAAPTVSTSTPVVAPAVVPVTPVPAPVVVPAPAPVVVTSTSTPTTASATVAPTPAPAATVQTTTAPPATAPVTPASATPTVVAPTAISNGTATVQDGNTDEEDAPILDLGNEQAEMDAFKDFTAVVRQSKPFYCGPAALATLRTQLGDTTSEHEILDQIPPENINEEKGTNMLALKTAAEKLGSKVVVKKWTADQVLAYIQDTKDPVLINDEKKNVGGHFSVIREYDSVKGLVELSDTEAGNIKYSVEDFKHIYTNSALVIYEGEKDGMLADATTDMADADAANVWGKYVPVYMAAEGATQASLVARGKFATCVNDAMKIQNYAQRNDARGKCYVDLGKALGSQLDNAQEVAMAKNVDASMADKNNKDNELEPGTIDILSALRGTVLPNQQKYIQAKNDYALWIKKLPLASITMDLVKAQLTQYDVKLSQAKLDKSTLDSSMNSKTGSIKSLQAEVDQGVFIQNGKSFSLGDVSHSLQATQATFSNLSSKLQAKMGDYDKQITAKQKDIASFQSSKNQAASDAAGYQNWANTWYNGYFISTYNSKTRRMDPPKWVSSWYSNEYNKNLSLASAKRSEVNTWQSRINVANADLNSINNAKNAAKNDLSSATAAAAAEQARVQKIKDFGDQEMKRKKDLLQQLNADLAKVQTQLSDRNKAIDNLQTLMVVAKDQITTFQNTKDAENIMAAAQKAIDGVKTRYGFSTLTYTNTDETQKLIDAELANEKSWDKVAENLATVDSRTAALNPQPQKQQNPQIDTNTSNSANNTPQSPASQLVNSAVTNLKCAAPVIIGAGETVVGVAMTGAAVAGDFACTVLFAVPTAGGAVLVCGSATVPAAAVGAGTALYGVNTIKNGVQNFNECKADNAPAAPANTSLSNSSGGGNNSQPLNRGSTADPSKGSTLPRNLSEQKAIEQAISNPTVGKILDDVIMNDARWPAKEGWVKMQQVIDTATGKVIDKGSGIGKIVVHYLRNTINGQIDDFKIIIQ